MKLLRPLSFSLAIVGCGVAGDSDSADSSEDAVSEGQFVRPVVVASSPLSLSNPNQDSVTRPLWGGAFTLTEAVALRVSLEAKSGEGGLVFGGRSDPDAEDDQSVAVELASRAGKWSLRELKGSEAVQDVAIEAPRSADLVVSFSQAGRRVTVKGGGSEVSLTLRGALASAAGTYVHLGPAAELAVRDVALTQALPASRNLGTPLRKLAAERGISIGTATDVWPPLHDAQFESLLAEQFDTAAPTELYWATTRGEDEDFFFLPADLMVNYATVHQQKINGYFLVWDFELPAWVNQAAESGDANALGKILDEHIDTTVRRYRGRMNSWVVANEAIWGPEETNGGAARYGDSIWEGTLGPEYIERAFRVARAADPNAKLIYNETGAETLNPKSDFLHQMAKDLLAKRAPIDAIGLQFHLDGAKLPKIEDVKANMERLAALGLDLYITELDVSLATVTGSEQEKLQLQARVYGDVLKTCLAVPRCRSYTVFGFGDKYAWDELGDASPLLFDEKYEAKPAFFTVQAGLANR